MSFSSALSAEAIRVNALAWERQLLIIAMIIIARIILGREFAQRFGVFGADVPILIARLRSFELESLI